MAYMSQERKQALAVEIKKALAGSGLKYTIAVRHHSTLVVNIQAGPVDFITNYNETVMAKKSHGGMHSFSPATTYLQVNEYHYKDHFSGKALEILEKLIPLMNVGNHDRSDIQSDYFDVGWYTDINIGKWDKPYQLLAA